LIGTLGWYHSYLPIKTLHFFGLQPKLFWCKQALSIALGYFINVIGFYSGGIRVPWVIWLYFSIWVRCGVSLGAVIYSGRWSVVCNCTSGCLDWCTVLNLWEMQERYSAFLKLYLNSEFVCLFWLWRYALHFSSP